MDQSEDDETNSSAGYNQFDSGFRRAVPHTRSVRSSFRSLKAKYKQMQTNAKKKKLVVRRLSGSKSLDQQSINQNGNIHWLKRIHSIDSITNIAVPVSNSTIDVVKKSTNEISENSVGTSCINEDSLDVSTELARNKTRLFKRSFSFRDTSKYKNVTKELNKVDGTNTKLKINLTKILQNSVDLKRKYSVETLNTETIKSDNVIGFDIIDPGGENVRLIPTATIDKEFMTPKKIAPMQPTLIPGQFQGLIKQTMPTSKKTTGPSKNLATAGVPTSTTICLPSQQSTSPSPSSMASINSMSPRKIFRENPWIFNQPQQHVVTKQKLNKINEKTIIKSKKELKEEKANFNKVAQINIHLHALFSAVEHGHMEKARTILDSTNVNVNSENSDGLSPLDMAVLSNNRSMTKMLLQYGAVEGGHFKNGETMGTHLNNLLQQAENILHELNGAVEEYVQSSYSARSSVFTGGTVGTNNYNIPTVTGCSGSENDKQISIWERRIKGLKRMLLGWDQSNPPDAPQLFSMEVTGTQTVRISINDSVEGPIATKCKVEWSTRADFTNIVGEETLTKWTNFQDSMRTISIISDLTEGRPYFFRACCGNIKGWGKYIVSSPPCVIPSSWRSIDRFEHRFDNRQRLLDDIFSAVRLLRPCDASELMLASTISQKRNPKKKTTIKQLFSGTFKFQKNLKRGIYLASILYHEDKILVTNEDFLPIIEIDESYPSSLHNDFHWLMKIACNWDDAKALKSDMEKNPVSAIHFRTKLLTAACQMQNALNLVDLGQFYYKPLKDANGTIVISCVNAIKSYKSVSVLNSRWIPLNKVQKKLCLTNEDNINDILLNSVKSQINFHQNSTCTLSDGLYFGYLKMQSSVEQIQVFVPRKTPNVLPYYKIRDNSHISAEEWDLLSAWKNNSPLFDNKRKIVSEAQRIFLRQITKAATNLFKYLDIPNELSLQHRLYNIEVIELTSKVSFLVICPPVESSCSVPGQLEYFSQRNDLMNLPIQIFEMIHMRTFHYGIIQKYSRLSCILQLDTTLANHLCREAFSAVEVQTSKDRLAKLQNLQETLNTVWKRVRWLIDVIGFARDRSMPGITFQDFYQIDTKFSGVSKSDCITSTTTTTQLLHPPNGENKVNKTSPGRGSWPGPTVSYELDSGNSFYGEYSKSEQQLTNENVKRTSAFLNTNFAKLQMPRKYSDDSNSTRSEASFKSTIEYENLVDAKMQASKSEDVLHSIAQHGDDIHHRKRADTVNSNFTVGEPSSESTNEIASKLEIDGKQHLQPFQWAPSSSTDDKETGSRSNYFIRGECNKSVKTVYDNRPINFESTVGNKNEQKIEKEKYKDNTKAGIEKETELKSSSSDDKQSGILQVYTAYDTGLTKGTSLRLHVTSNTTAREVIDLVVKQLNMTILLKSRNGPIYPPDKLDNFCLVAVIGARERCLRDDFKPLQLQNPWKQGRLYIRQKHDLLAAIQQSNQEAQLI